MQECAVVLGSCGFRESREKGGNTLRPVWKSWKSRGAEVFTFWLGGSAHGERRDSDGVVWCLMDGYEVFVDIYSCDRS